MRTSPPTVMVWEEEPTGIVGAALARGGLADKPWSGLAAPLVPHPVKAPATRSSDPSPMSIQLRGNWSTSEQYVATFSVANADVMCNTGLGYIGGDRR